MDNSVVVETMKDGPNLIPGPLKLVDAHGKEVVIDRKWVALCRCDQSNNKPLCDGTHSKVGFKSDEVKFYKP